jgi:hypothetical protein
MMKKSLIVLNLGCLGYVAACSALLALSPHTDAHADDDNVGVPSNASTPSSGRSGGRHGARGQSSGKPGAKASPGLIRGGCSIVVSATNPLAGPCVNLLLILNDAQGIEQGRSRTNSQGQFEFTSTTGMDYRVAPGSKYYDLVSPTAVVHGGDKVDLKLQQK